MHLRMFLHIACVEPDYLERQLIESCSKLLQRVSYFIITMEQSYSDYILRTK